MEKQKSEHSLRKMAMREKYGKHPDNPTGFLTAQQKEFVKNYGHHGMTALAAARAAGYKDARNQSEDLLKMSKIQLAIARERKRNADVSDMTRKKVIDGFVEAIDLARLKADPLAMISGWREVGKMCGFYEPTRTKVEVSVGGQIMLDQLKAKSDAELLALIGEQTPAIEAEYEVVTDGNSDEQSVDCEYPRGSEQCYGDEEGIGAEDLGEAPDVEIYADDTPDL